jgi:hypothetical protein
MPREGKEFFGLLDVDLFPWIVYVKYSPTIFGYQPDN